MGSCMSCKAGKEAHDYTTAPAARPKQRARFYHSMENGPFSTITQVSYPFLIFCSLFYSVVSNARGSGII